MKEIMFQWQLYAVLLAMSVVGFRVITFISWIAAGWPEWVASGFLESTEEIDSFAEDLNNILSISNFAVPLVNVAVGVFVNWMRRNNADDRLGPGLKYFYLRFYFKVLA